jgi:hypothetical protein
MGPPAGRNAGSCTTNSCSSYHIASTQSYPDRATGEGFPQSSAHVHMSLKVRPQQKAGLPHEDHPAPNFTQWKSEITEKGGHVSDILRFLLLPITTYLSCRVYHRRSGPTIHCRVKLSMLVVPHWELLPPSPSRSYAGWMELRYSWLIKEETEIAISPS